MYYCGKSNQLINCKCLSRICSKGNCLCVKCMKYNIKKKKLKNYQLINKAGRVANVENGVYYCGSKYKVEIRDEIGNIIPIFKICSNGVCCPNCKILNKFKKDYLNYIYGQ